MDSFAVGYVRMIASMIMGLSSAGPFVFVFLAFTDRSNTIDSIEDHIQFASPSGFKKNQNYLGYLGSFFGLYTKVVL